MLKIIIATYILTLSLVCIDVESRIFNIDLMRQRSPRENLHLARQHGFELGLNDKPKNASNYTLALKRYLDNEFYGTVRIGSTGQEYYVIFDTAWSTSWIMSKDCSAQVVGCAGHRLYDHVRSATYVANGTKYHSGQGNESFTGYYSYDKINYGGTKLEKQLFVEMTNVPDELALVKADGVIALTLPYNGEKTMPILLYEQGLLKRPVFSIYLNRDTQSNRGGSIMLGSVDTKHIHVTNKVRDEVTYVQVDNVYGTWMFNFDGAAIIENKTSIPICIHGCKAYVDTGSINIYASQGEVEKINSIIHAKPDHNEQGRFIIDCATIMKLPPFNFIIGGQNFILRGRDYVQKEIKESQQNCYSVFRMPEISSESGSWVLGASFLSRFFSIYNFQKKTIGFVTAA